MTAGQTQLFGCGHCHVQAKPCARVANDDQQCLAMNGSTQV